MAQTLDKGAVPQSRFEGLGGYSGTQTFPPERMTAFIFGLPGSGKSAFVQSAPNAFIFNFDATSTVSPTPNAVMWPGVSSSASGCLIDDQGNPFVLAYEPVMEKLEILYRLAKENKPRPDTIVFDTITSWIALLREYVPRKAATIGIHKEDNALWKDLHGPAAWDYVYDAITQTITKLRNYGYGVYVLGHVVKRWIPLAENKFKPEFEFTITDGFWRRLCPIFELSACMVCEDRTTTVVHKQTQNIGGRSIEIEKKVPVTARTCTLYLSRSDLDGMTKGRRSITEINIPRENGWAAFAKAYAEAPI